MACTRPVAVRRRGESLSTYATDLVPCGHCLGCDLERSRQWAVRCMHEASLHEDNSYITLTYDDEYLPAGGSLDPSAFPLFMRRLRKVVSDVRYFYCGEYGEEFFRPHYHAILFGWWPVDAVQCGTRGDYPVYRSADLAALWPYGFSELGSVTFDSAAYVARYVTKKVFGEAAAEHYLRVDVDSGEVFGVVPEFAQMSRRPGIGSRWFSRFGGELERNGKVVVAGKESPMPRYYRKLMDKSSPGAADRLQKDAYMRQWLNEPKMTEAQLAKNEEYLKASHNLWRSLE